MIRLVLRRLLMPAGLKEIGVFESGAVAALAIRNGRLVPDYLFADVKMPLMDGPGFISEVRPLLPQSRIYMVTLHGKKEKVEKPLKGDQWRYHDALRPGFGAGETAEAARIGNAIFSAGRRLPTYGGLDSGRKCARYLGW